MHSSNEIDGQHSLSLTMSPQRLPRRGRVRRRRVGIGEGCGSGWGEFARGCSLQALVRSLLLMLKEVERLAREGLAVLGSTRLEVVRSEVCFMALEWILLEPGLLEI